MHKCKPHKLKEIAHVTHSPHNEYVLLLVQTEDNGSDAHFSGVIHQKKVLKTPHVIN